MYHPIHAWDRRHARNAATVRNVLQEIINERRQGESKSFNEGQTDLLDILLTDELYSMDEEKIKDELVMFFVAGMETIQISSANLIYYVTEKKHI
jgi:cytochrome P450